MMQVTFQVGTVVGPALSGILLGIGLPLVYGLDALSFVVASVTSFLLGHPARHDGKALSPWQSTKEGLRYLRSRQALQGVYLIDVNAMVFGLPRALFPAMADRSSVAAPSRSASSTPRRVSARRSAPSPRVGWPTCAARGWR